MIANSLTHLFAIALQVTLLLMILPIKRKPLSVVAGLLIILFPYPLYLLLTGQEEPVLGKPWVLYLGMMYVAFTYRYLVLTVGFRQIIFTIVTTMSHMYVSCILIYYLFVEVLGFPGSIETNLLVRRVYLLTLVPLIPLARRYARPYFQVVLEAVERQKTWFILLLCTALWLLGYAAVSVFLWRNDPQALLSCLGIAFAIVVFYYTLYRFIVAESANRQLRNQIEFSRQLAKTYDFYDTELRGKEQAVRTLRHDFRHTVHHLETLLREKDYAGVAKHLAGVAGKTSDSAPTPYCENVTVNALVSYHFALAEAKGIHCAAKLFVPERLGVPVDELSVILGNALENTVKGAETMGDTGYVEVSAKPVNDCVVFDIENNHRPGAYRKGMEVGLSSIRTLCEKNDGRARAIDANGTFKLNIVLRLD